MSDRIIDVIPEALTHIKLNLKLDGLILAKSEKRNLAPVIMIDIFPARFSFAKFLSSQDDKFGGTSNE